MVNKIFRAIWRSSWFDTGFYFSTFGLVVLYGYIADRQASSQKDKIRQKLKRADYEQAGKIFNDKE